MKSFLLISLVVLAVCAHCAVVKTGKKQFINPFSSVNEKYPYGPFGLCGKPEINIPHGGIDLFDDHDRRLTESECETAVSCEPKFYCDEGYRVVGEHELDCFLNLTTMETKWQGHTPKCVKRMHHTFFIIIPIPFVVTGTGVLWRYFMKARRSTRSTGSTLSTPATRSSIATVDKRRPKWGKGYKRFDDSSIQTVAKPVNA